MLVYFAFESNTIMESHLSAAGRLFLLFTSALLLHESSYQLDSGRLIIDIRTAKCVTGRYVQDGCLGILFNLRQGFIELRNLQEDILVRYEDITDDVFYFQVLQNVFVGKKSSAVPFLIREARSVNSEKTDHLNLSHFGLLPLRARKKLFTGTLLKAIKALHGIEEISLLRHLSIVLKEDTSDRLLTNQLHGILRQFYVMRIALFPPTDITGGNLRTSHEKNATLSFVHQERVTSFGDERVSQSDVKPRKSTKSFPRETLKSILEKRHKIKRRNGVDLSSDPSNNECLGMCGRGCTCMESVCGDCDFNRWCYGHDQCCRNDYMTTWCLLPFIYVEASCDDDFKGVPKCLQYKPRY